MAQFHHAFWGGSDQPVGTGLHQGSPCLVGFGHNRIWYSLTLTCLQPPGCSLAVVRSL